MDEDEQTDSASAPAGPRFGQAPPPPPVIPTGAGGERPEAADSEDHKSSVAVDVGPDPDKTSVSVTVDFDGDGTTSVDRGAGSETAPTPASAGFEREAGVDTTTAAGASVSAAPFADPTNQKAHAPTPEGIARSIDRGPQDAGLADKGSVAAEIDDDFGSGLPAAGVRGVRTVNDLDGDADFGAGAGGDDSARGDADAMDRKPAADVVSAGLDPADTDLESDAGDLDAGEDEESFELPDDDLGGEDVDADDVPDIDDLDDDKVEDLGGHHL